MPFAWVRSPFSAAIATFALRPLNDSCAFFSSSAPAFKTLALQKTLKSSLFLPDRQDPFLSSILIIKFHALQSHINLCIIVRIKH